MTVVRILAKSKQTERVRRHPRRFFLTLRKRSVGSFARASPYSFVEVNPFPFPFPFAFSWDVPLFVRWVTTVILYRVLLNEAADERQPRFAVHGTDISIAVLPSSLIA